MEVLAPLFVGEALNILGVAVTFSVAYLTLRFTALGIGRQPRPLLIAFIAWGLYAG